MPDKLIPGKKRTMAYKKGPFKMKGSPTKDRQTKIVNDPDTGTTRETIVKHEHPEEEKK